MDITCVDLFVQKLDLFYAEYTQLNNPIIGVCSHVAQFILYKNRSFIFFINRTGSRGI
jgi:hypothetical protein